jgi:hypothetical protein
MEGSGKLRGSMDAGEPCRRAPEHLPRIVVRRYDVQLDTLAGCADNASRLFYCCSVSAGGGKVTGSEVCVTDRGCDAMRRCWAGRYQQHTSHERAGRHDDSSGTLHLNTSLMLWAKRLWPMRTPGASGPRVGSVDIFETTGS